ncbi:hypothetical protein L0F63_000400 [Massospora cicadina]|nr:hypothetical protein L0F63_000400 [Massospora cicadina]
MKISNLFVVAQLTTETLGVANSDEHRNGIQSSKVQRNSWKLILVNKFVPKLCDDVAQASGIIKTYFGEQFFFWFFESRHRPNKDPLIVYINGAMGLASILGLNSGMFPCHVNNYGNTTRRNPFSWNNFANLLILDPIGIGFAPVKVGGHDVELKATDLVNAISQFLSVHPYLRGVPIHLASESYGASIVLEIAHLVVRETDTEGVGEIPLKSVIVVISGIKLKPPGQCQVAILKCRNDENRCEAAIETCIANLVYPYHAAGFNIYQLPGFKPHRSKSIHLSILIFLTENFLNLDAVKNELGIPPTFSFNYFNPSRFKAAAKSSEFFKDHTTTISEISNHGIRVLYYGGEMDYLCNPMGFISALDSNINSLSSHLTGAEIGSVTRTDKLTAIKFTNASHYVQIDQPQFLYEILTRWVSELSI